MQSSLSQYLGALELVTIYDAACVMHSRQVLNMEVEKNVEHVHN